MIISLIAIIFIPFAKLIKWQCLAIESTLQMLQRALGYPLGLASALEKLASNQSPKQAGREGFANDATAGLFIVNPLAKNVNVN